jgi:hypothetical protein
MSAGTPACLDIENWRASTPDEMLAYFDADQPRDPPRVGSMLVVRTHLSPVDLYAYLVARFGQPNGFQNFLRRDDSDNWIHWDFNLKAGDTNVYFAGATREIHVTVSEPLTDEQWKALIETIKRDYRRIGRSKSDVKRTFEKYVVFQNKFVSLSSLCADLHERIVDTPILEKVKLNNGGKEDIELYKEAMQKVSKRGEDLYGDCLKLSLIAPIMAEAFFNLMILVFCKDKIRNDPETYKAFLRAKIPDRLTMLTRYCDGFVQHIDTKTDAYADFMRVINKRNFALHGNMEPVREQIEVAFFEGKRPLMVKAGNSVDVLFEQLERLHAPPQVTKDYENVQLFLLEVMECLSDRHLAFFEAVLNDPFPGYDVNRKRVTRLFPNYVTMGMFEGMRYDDQLKVEW